MQGLFFIEADEDELNELVTGTPVGLIAPWDRRSNQRRASGRFGVVLSRRDEVFDLVQPLAIALDESAQRRLFGRFSTLREDLSPISSWCHVFENRLFDMLADSERPAWLGGLEAAWCGVIVAEAAALADRPTEKLRIAACLATAGFAVGRTTALWQKVQIEEVVTRHERLQALIRGSAGATQRLSPRFGSIWRALLSAADGPTLLGSGLTSRAVRALLDSRIRHLDDEHLALASLFSGWPEFAALSRLPSMTPEERVRLFDTMVSALRGAGAGHDSEATAFVAGYLATVAAGGQPSMGLAEGVAKEFPEVLGWAYAIGGIGEPVSWASGFYGLGRLVSRELLRTFRLDDAPTCDFSFDEANHLVDKQLADPLAHLKIKQQRLLTVALYPGVNVTVPVSEFAEQGPQPVKAPSPSQPDSGASAIVDMLWPAFLRRLEEEGLMQQPYGTKGGRKKGSQSKPSSPR